MENKEKSAKKQTENKPKTEKKAAADLKTQPKKPAPAEKSESKTKITEKPPKVQPETKEPASDSKSKAQTSKASTESKSRIEKMPQVEESKQSARINIEESKNKNVKSDSTEIKKRQTKKTSSKNKQDETVIKDYEVGDVQVKPSAVKSTLTSVVFWTVIFTAIVLLIGFNVFNTRPVLPESASAVLTAEQQVRYGDESQITLDFNKPVTFQDEADVIWTIDGIEVQRGSTKEKASMSLQYRFPSVGRHNVKANVEGFDNLSAESEIEVLKPRLTVTVQDCERMYGEENPLPKYEISGFVDNDTLNTLDLKFDAGFEADKTSPVGEYAVKNTMQHDKYEIETKGGKLKVLPRKVVVTSQNIVKVYDGNDNVIDPEFSVGNTVGEDVMTVKCKSAVYSDKNVGKNKEVTVKEIVLEGKNAKNYALPEKLVFTGEITAKNLVLEGTVVSDKYYDGNTSATFQTLGTFNGFIDNDDVSVGEVNARFETATVGKEKRVLIEKMTLVGKDAHNYLLETPQGLTASINGDNTVIKSNEILGEQQ